MKYLLPLLFSIALLLLVSCQVNESSTSSFPMVEEKAFSYLSQALDKTNKKEGYHQIDIHYPFTKEEISQGKNPYYRYIYDIQGQAIALQGRDISSLENKTSIIKKEGKYIFQDEKNSPTIVDSSYYLKVIPFLSRPTYQYFSRMKDIHDLEEYALIKTKIELAKYQYECSTLPVPLKTDEGKVSLSDISISLTKSENKNSLTLSYTSHLEVETYKIAYTSRMVQISSYTYQYTFSKDDILTDLTYEYLFNYQEYKKEGNILLDSTSEKKVYTYAFSYPENVDCFTLDVEIEDCIKPIWYNPVYIHSTDYFYIYNGLEEGIDNKNIFDPYFSLDQNLFELEIYHDRDLNNIVEEKEIIPMNQTLYGKVIPKEGYSVVYSLYEFSFYHEYDDYASYILDDDHPSIYMWDIKIVPVQENYQDIPLEDEDYSFSLHDINQEEGITSIDLKEKETYLFHYVSEADFFTVMGRN